MKKILFVLFIPIILFAQSNKALYTRDSTVLYVTPTQLTDTASVLNDTLTVYRGELNGLQTQIDTININDLVPREDINELFFDVTPTVSATAVGQVYWNEDDATLNVELPNGVSGQMFQELYFDVINKSGSELTNGMPIMFKAPVGNSGKVQVQKAIADGSIPSQYIMGIVTETIANGDSGKVTCFGKVRGINTTGTPYSETWVDGDLIYVSTTTAGALTNVEPQAPDQRILIATVITAHTNGTLLVRPTWNEKIVDLDDVDGTALTTNGQIMVWSQDSLYFDFNYNIGDYYTETETNSNISDSLAKSFLRADSNTTANATTKTYVDNLLAGKVAYSDSGTIYQTYQDLIDFLSTVATPIMQQEISDSLIWLTSGNNFYPKSVLYNWGTLTNPWNLAFFDSVTANHFAGGTGTFTDVSVTDDLIVSDTLFGLIAKLTATTSDGSTDIISGHALGGTQVFRVQSSGAMVTTYFFANSAGMGTNTIYLDRPNQDVLLERSAASTFALSTYNAGYIKRLIIDNTGATFGTVAGTGSLPVYTGSLSVSGDLRVQSDSTTHDIFVGNATYSYMDAGAGWTTSSDSTLKENIVALSSVLDNKTITQKILNTNLYKYNFTKEALGWKDVSKMPDMILKTDTIKIDLSAINKVIKKDTSYLILNPSKRKQLAANEQAIMQSAKEHFGFIAQNFGEVWDGNQGNKQIDWNKVAVIEWYALQELIKEVVSLKQDVKAIKTKLGM